MLVKFHTSEGNYVLQDLVSQEVRDYHVSRLRTFLYDERTLTPMQVAVTDTLDEFVAEQVIDMRGDSRNSRKNLSFLIRWAGYGPSDDTWEPWSMCKDSVAVQNHLRDHKLPRIRRLAKPIDTEMEEFHDEDDESDNSDDNRELDS